jgi:hypothetical protein
MRTELAQNESFADDIEGVKVVEDHDEGQSANLNSCFHPI